MFSGLGHVVFFVELPEQLLEERSHHMIVQSRENFIPLVIHNRPYAEVDAAVGEFVYDGAQSTGLGEVVHLLTQFELIDDVLHVLTVAVQILDEVHLETERIHLGL